MLDTVHSWPDIRARLFAPMDRPVSLPPPAPLSSAWFGSFRREVDLRLEDYRFDPVRYCREKLGFEPWASYDQTNPGQVEVLEAYALALRQMHEREDYLKGRTTLEQLQWWKPGVQIKNWLRWETGHGFGKTWTMAAIQSHFGDTCTPSIAYSFAPSMDQVVDLLWKSFRQQREGKGLPGNLLPAHPRWQVSPYHFASGRAVPLGKGTGKIQGQHGPYQLIIIDEATDVGAIVYNSLDALTSSGICIVLLAANPSNRTCRFHQLRTQPQVMNIRGSCLKHPNAVQGYEVIKGGVKREWLDERIDAWCEEVPAHDPKRYTFTVPWRPGKIYAPLETLEGDEFLYRVLGIAPGRTTTASIISPAQYEAAKTRTPEPGDRSWVTIGLDCSRFGTDKSALASRFDNHVRIFARLDHHNRDGAPTFEVTEATKKEALRCRQLGATKLYLRIDAGYGGGVADVLMADVDLRKAFARVVKTEVNFGGSPRNSPLLADRSTELYILGARELDSVRLVDPPATLEQDLVERTYSIVQKKLANGYRSLRKLWDKGEYHKETGHSPDDGDALMLCILPPALFGDDGQESGPAIEVFGASPWRSQRGASMDPDELQDPDW